MQVRETGSILLDAPRDRVFDVLARWMETDPALRRVADDRFESLAPDAGVSTFIIRDDGSRTRVIHARAAPRAIGIRPREELREQVEAELVRVQRLVEAYGQQR